jgi:tetratricopeptide (TPR) repeat protein
VGAGFALNFSEAGKRLNTVFFEKIILREIEKEPYNAKLYSMLGDIYYTRKNYGGVQKAYEMSLYLVPDNPQVLNNLAWFYATCEDIRFRDYPRALILAKKAASLEQTPYILDTLAESYYVNGMFNEAIATAEKALESANKNASPIGVKLRY